MKIQRSIIFGLVIITIISVSFQGALSAESLQQSSYVSKHELSEFSIFDISNIEINEHMPLWYPGFLLVQLVRGVIAFIIVLLILFDLIEPT
jgi:hypothetical protein